MAPKVSNRDEESIGFDTEVLGEGQQHVLDREIVITHLSSATIGLFETSERVATELRGPATNGPRQTTDDSLEARGDASRVGLNRGQQRLGDAFSLGEEGDQEMGGDDLWVPERLRLGLRSGVGLSGADRPALWVERHGLLPSSLRPLRVERNDRLADGNDLPSILTMGGLNGCRGGSTECLDLTF